MKFFRSTLLSLSALMAVAMMLAAAPSAASGVNRFRAAIEAQSKGDLDRALALYTQALRDGDLSHEQLSVSAYNRGIIFFSKKKYDLAISDFDTAIWLRPEYADAYHNRGLARNRAGRYEDAIADFSMALKFKPDYPSALNNRGNAYRARNEFDKALADYDKAIALRPEYGFGYYNRGLALEAKAILLEGDSADVTNAASQIQALRRGARQSYEKAGGLIPDHPAIKAKLAQTSK